MQNIRNQLHLSREILPKSAVKQKKTYTYQKLTLEDRQAIADIIIKKADKLRGSLFPEVLRTADRLEKEAHNYAHCGHKFAILSCLSENVNFRSPVSCNSRICENCARRYANRMRKDINRLFKPVFSKKVRGYGLFMLTLTTTTKRYEQKAPGREDIKRFYKESGEFLKYYYGKYKCRLHKGKVIEDQRRVYYEKNRAGKKIKKRYPCKIRINKKGEKVEDYRKYKGGGYVASVEFGGKSNMLHLHAIVYGPYVPIRLLREMWLRLTGDSFVVDIRPVRQPEIAADYVLKYIWKVPQTDSYNDLADYVVAIKGSRRIRTGGIFYGKIARRRKEKTLNRKCPFCGSDLWYWKNENIYDVKKSDYLPLYYLKRIEEDVGRKLPNPFEPDGSEEDRKLKIMLVEKLLNLN